MAIAFCFVILAACGGCGPEEPPPAKQPNVLIFLVDTLRKDRLHLYGYERRTSDFLDKMAEEGWVFDNHMAHASQTVPSTLSLMLGQYPAEHGFTHTGPGHFNANKPVYPEEFLFLTEVFHQAGYRTAGFVGNVFLGEENQFNQGFDDFEFMSYKEKHRADLFADKAIAWLKEHAAGPDPQPFFLYMHLMDVHQPYVHPEPYMSRFPLPEGGSLLRRNGLLPHYKPEDLEFTSSSYDAGIPFVDDQFARLVQALAELGEKEDTIIVFTSDHGDEFMEHGGLGHGTTVYGELIRVPLVMRYPGKLEPGKRVSHLTQHVDVAPTLVELAGLDPVDRFSKGNLLTGSAPRVYSENGPWRAVYAGGFKLIRNETTGSARIYSVADEHDQKPVDNEQALRSLNSLLHGYKDLGRMHDEKRSGQSPDSATWSDEELERLRNLGYIK